MKSQAKEMTNIAMGVDAEIYSDTSLATNAYSIGYKVKRKEAVQTREFYIQPPFISLVFARFPYLVSIF